MLAVYLNQNYIRTMHTSILVYLSQVTESQIFNDFIAYFPHMLQGWRWGGILRLGRHAGRFHGEPLYEQQGHAARGSILTAARGSVLTAARGSILTAARSVDAEGQGYTHEKRDLHFHPTRGADGGSLQQRNIFYIHVTKHISLTFFIFAFVLKPEIPNELQTFLTTVLC